MNVQHLSDEAVAAYADGVLRGHSRERAARHVESCVECLGAVRVQREAAFALRAAPAPALPSALADRLRSVPMTTTISNPSALPTVVAPDGNTMFATFAPAAALVPADQPAGRARFGSRAKPAALTFALVALAGTLTAGSVARDADEPSTGSGAVAHQISSRHSNSPGGPGSALFDAGRP
ncbi:hypothetical protein [uncultured Jatrophihabitans sp.]|uniref:hypothetical protein n=1 Tax=uncultured Jatrophihabitans sp. TaxID=1610747 RepID=UPI0035CA7150